MYQPELNDILNKYKSKVEEELGTKSDIVHPQRVSSMEYNDFKSSYLPAHMTTYEKLCNLSEKILKITPDKNKEKSIQESINISHLNVTPVGVISFSLLLPIFVAFFGSAFFYILLGDMFFVLLFFTVAVILINPLSKVPLFMANSWRMKASNQMVLCIFYVATFMRHSANIENAIWFASEHLTPPLSLDLKKVLWDVETEKYESVNASLEAYLATWRKWNSEFVESFHLIQSSLYEGSEDRRIIALDKALDVILNETYEKMLHYAHNLKSPITMLHMLGVILPILGLVILPLVVSFMSGVKWYHLSVIYNLFLPILVYYLSRDILSKRPTGYGDTDMSQDNPEIMKYGNSIFRVGKTDVAISPLWLSIFVGAIMFIIGISPLLLHMWGMPDFGMFSFQSPCDEMFCFLGYVTGEDGELGPFGFGASILSFFVTLAAGISIGMYYKISSKNIIKVRERTRKLEDEFANSLFQLGNRLGDGIPAEMAMGKVAETVRGTTSGDFFALVDANIKRLGMSVYEAIFNPKRGALVHFPSRIIESSMKVLVESIKKGPEIAAQALMNISRYIKEIHKVNERLKDMMADIISSMQSQIKFLTPAISGIVVGITSMISIVIRKLTTLAADVQHGSEGMSAGFDFSPGIPTFFFQIMVGVYVVQIVYILTILSNGVENGSDKLSERFLLGNNLIKSTILYVIIAMTVTILFNFIAGSIMEGIAV